MEKVQALKSFEDLRARKYIPAIIIGGILFPLVTVSVDLLSRGILPTAASIVSRHQQNPLYYVVDALSLLLIFGAHHILRLMVQAQRDARTLNALDTALSETQEAKDAVAQQIASVLDLSPVSYALIGSDGLIHYVNSATQGILGSAQTKGMNIFSFGSVKSTVLEAKLKRTARGAHEHLENYQHVSATTGVEKILNISLIPFRKESSGDAYEVLMMTTDRTEEKILLDQVESNFFNVVMGLARALDARDRYTSHHSANVKAYTAIIAYNLPLTPEERKDILIAAELHDIGKIGIGDHILHKNGPLTEEEFTCMKSHPSTGADFFSGIEGYSRISEIIRHHHERMDGRGYPEGLTGDAIPRGASIIAIADAFDAMTTDRIYRKAMTIDDAMAELSRGAGTQFHPAYVEIFLRHFKT